MILKPSPQTPTIVEHVGAAFERAGVPHDVIQHFHCGSFDKIEAMIQRPEISLVCFTGSAEGGMMVQRAAVRRTIPVILELGGKDAAYVRSDVDIDWAAGEIVDGAVFNSGQSCCSIERVYVDKEIHDELVRAIQQVLRGYKLGPPMQPETHLGPVVSRRAQGAIEEQVKDALTKGARDLTPENASFENCSTEGNYVRPRLLVDVTHEMTIMRDETFGPIIPVMRVQDDDEAVHRMNDSTFGLTASIWTKDLHRGQMLADQVEAGTVFVNRCDYPSPVCAASPAAGD